MIVIAMKLEALLCLQVVTLQNPALDAPLLGPGDPPMLAELQALAQRYAQQRTRAELGQAWRPGLARLHKLMASLEAWLGYCPAKQRRQFLQSLQPMLQEAWGLHADMQVRNACFYVQSTCSYVRRTLYMQKIGSQVLALSA